MTNMPSSATTLAPPSLPNIPNMIFPKTQLDLNQNFSGYTLISILFDQELNWPFVVNNSVSSSQIFAFLPLIISTALQIDPSQVKTYCLEVYVPSTYHNTSDMSQLGTMWLGFIPTNLVDTLAAEIKATQSAFYNGVPNAVAKQLAGLVNSGFNLISVAPPATGGASGSSSAASGSSNSKSRQDAIIGVVTALGAIAVLVLVFLGYRSFKRRRELAHRQLSDPTPANAFVGARPEGREFDQDSVGGARRRSFYYAEDSLRGFQGERPEEGHFDGRANSAAMSQRRNVVPAAISAPILRESSMNW